MEGKGQQRCLILDTTETISDKIRSSRLKLAGHCFGHPQILANDLVTWEPKPRRGETRRGRPRQSYLSTLLRDVGINTKEELRTLMRDRDIWRKISAVDRTDRSDLLVVVVVVEVVFQ